MIPKWANFTFKRRQGGVEITVVTGEVHYVFVKQLTSWSVQFWGVLEEESPVWIQDQAKGMNFKLLFKSLQNLEAFLGAVASEHRYALWIRILWMIRKQSQV